MKPALLLTLLAALCSAGCKKPAVNQDVYRPRVEPIDPVAAVHRGSEQDRVQLLRPDLLPPELRGPSQIDGFVQDDALVDILWVIDNSGSMDNERARLGNAFTAFITALTQEQISFQIGVTTTDMNQQGVGFNGELIGPPNVITNTTTNPVGAFQSHVTMPPSDVEQEQGFFAALAAVSEPMRSGANAGFIRPEADLAIIVVSDEDDGSLGDTLHYARRFRALKGPGNEDTVTFSAVIGDLPDGCVSAEDADILWAEAEPGDRYVQMAALMGGIVASVCDANFNDTLEQLGLAFSGLRRIFPLSAEPDVSTLRVRVDGANVARNPNSGWIWDAGTRSVQFLGNYVPPPGSEIEVRYDLVI